MVSGTIWWHMGKAKNPGRYIILRSVAKSAAVSEDWMRGQPSVGFAVIRLV